MPVQQVAKHRSIENEFNENGFIAHFCFNLKTFWVKGGLVGSAVAGDKSQRTYMVVETIQVCAYVLLCSDVSKEHCKLVL